MGVLEMNFFVLIFFYFEVCISVFVVGIGMVLFFLLNYYIGEDFINIKFKFYGDWCLL